MADAKIPVPPVASADEIGEALAALKRCRKILEEKSVAPALARWIGESIVAENAEGGAV